MSNQGLKFILRSPATWLATLAAFQPKKTEALNALPVSRDAIVYEIRDDFAASPKISADTYTGLVDSLSPTPQRRFDDVFGALTNLYKGLPDQFLELCALVREGKSQGLDVSAAVSKLAVLRSQSNSAVSKIWTDFEETNKTGKSKEPVKASRQALADARKELVALSTQSPGGHDSIDDVHRRLVERYGEDQASAALVTVFPKLPGKIRDQFDRTALLRLAKVSSDFYGRFDRFQMIFESLRPGTVGFDSNRNGQVDAADRMYSAGSVKFEKVGHELADEVNVRNAVINAAHELNHRRPGFAGNLFSQSFPGGFFDRVSDNGVFQSKPDVSESSAILSVFSQPSASQMDCAAGSKTVVQYRAALAVLGPEDFDRVFDGLVMGSHMTSRAHHLEFRPTGGTNVKDIAPDTFLSELKPGDVVYFGQQHVTDQMRDSGWSGEWATFLGDGQFYGHPVGIKSYEGMRSYGELRHKKWTLLPSIMEYDEGGWSKSHRAYEKTLTQRLQKMKVGLERVEASELIVGAYAIGSMLELGQELNDSGVEVLIRRIFQRSAESLVKKVKQGEMTVEAASLEMGVSAGVMQTWIENGVPRPFEVTIPSLAVWSEKR